MKTFNIIRADNGQVIGAIQSKSKIDADVWCLKNNIDIYNGYFLEETYVTDN